MYYCEDDRVEIKEQTGTIRTLREGKVHYDNNMKCSWLVKGLKDSDNVYIHVNSTDLAWAPESAICNGHDFVEVRTGKKMFNVYLCTLFAIW